MTGDRAGEHAARRMVDTQTRAAGRAPGGDEAALVARLGAGDEAAFEALLAAHAPAMLRLATSIVGRGALASEVVQDTWAALLDGLEDFEQRSSLKTWLLRVVVKRSLTAAAKERRHVSLDSFEPGDEGPTVDPARFAAIGWWTRPPGVWEPIGPEHEMLRRESLTLLAAALEQLPAAQRSVVVLRDIEGCEADEVCAILNVSAANQRVLLHRARARLREALAPHLEKA